LVAACAALAGCGEGPSQVGAAAIVGSDTVSLSAVQRQVDSVLGNPEVASRVSHAGATPADVARLMVSRDVQHLLLTEAARREGIVVDERQVDAVLGEQGVAAKLAGTFVFDPASARDAVRDQLISKALTTKYLDRLNVTADLVQVSTRSEAEATARQLAAGGAQAQAALANGDPGTTQAGLKLRAAALPQLAGSPIFGTPAGQVIAIQGDPSYPWMVVRVTDRRLDGPAVTDPGPSAMSQLDDRSISVIGRRLTQPLSEELGVRVNPRYGAWDPVALGVLPPDQATSMILPAAKTAGQNP
ncbi:MAG: hypothetical protein J2P19_16650, partial [Pseudonocardia sp.]|nr:hypothetical protein [Pseudonocardia sp.]